MFAGALMIAPQELDHILAQLLLVFRGNFPTGRLTATEVSSLLCSLGSGAVCGDVVAGRELLESSLV